MKYVMINSVIVLLMISISSLSLKVYKNKEKLTSFECGLNTINPPKTPFSVQFFKTLLLFIIFDMEIIVILPISLTKINSLNLLNLTLLIMTLLFLGLMFEWKEGSLEWLK